MHVHGPTGAWTDGSAVVGAALVGLGVLLAVVLQRVGLLELVAGVAGRRAQLLHLVPRRRALPAGAVLRARLLGLLDALRHLVRDARRRGRPTGPARDRAAAHHHRPERDAGRRHLRPVAPGRGRRERRGGRQAHAGQCRRHCNSRQQLR